MFHAPENTYWTNIFRIKEVYRIPKDSVDVLCLGSSMAGNSFSTMTLYHDYGISSYNAGTAQQSIENSYLILSDILKTQHPKVVLLEAYMPFFVNKNKDFFRTTFDTLKWSKEKWQVLKYLSEDYLNDSKLSFLLPVLKFHNRFKEIRKEDFTEVFKKDHYGIFKGYLMRDGMYSPEQPMESLRINDIDNIEPNKQIKKYISEKFNEQANEYLFKIAELCRSNNIEMIIFKTPVDLRENEWSATCYKTMLQWSKQNGIPYIDFNLENIAMECGFDFTTDQSDNVHQNSLGAIKLTKYLGKYLHENYNLPDRRSDSAYAFLDKEWERYERELFNEKFVYITNLSTYLDHLQNAGKDYTAIISVRDEAVMNLDDELRNKLRQLGFTSNFSVENAYQNSFIGIWRDGKVIYENLSKGNGDPERDVLEFKGTMPDSMKYYVKSAGYKVGNESSIVIDGAQMSKNGRGMNIVIYDSLHKRVIDSIVFDTHKDAGITYKR